MKEMIQDVNALHEKMGAPSTTVIDYTHAKFRLEFLFEELTELAHALGYKWVSGNIEGVDTTILVKTGEKENDNEVLDGIIDMLYVTIGTGLYFGFDNKHDSKESVFETAWKRVQIANMQKIPVKSANESKRNIVFDLIKPDSWKKPDFTDLINNIKKGELHAEH